MPVFSVVIFTKNRSDLVGFALESVLNQSFPDYEVIIADNDDTDATAKVVRSYQDSRIRYHRTGNLSMVDNWEASVSLACGQYVLSLTDRSVFKSYALERIKKAIDQFGEDVYVWSYDILFGTLDEILFSKASGKAETVLSPTLFDLFLTEEYCVYSECLPRGLNSCCSRSVLEDIKRTSGRCFLPVAPDYTLAFLTLAHRPRIVQMNESLFVWGYGHLSNGGGLYTNSPYSEQTFREMDLSELDLVKHVPIKTKGIHNLLCNDLMRLKQIYPDHFAGIDLRPIPYFVTCRKEIDQWLSPDHPSYREKVSAWEEALAKQPDDIQTEVRAALTEPSVDLRRKLWRVFYNSSMATNARRQLAKRRSHFPKFEDILQATHWIEEAKGEKRVNREP